MNGHVAHLMALSAWGGFVLRRGRVADLATLSTHTRRIFLTAVVGMPAAKRAGWFSC